MKFFGSICIVLTILSFSVTSAQNLTQSIRGKIIDSESSQPLPGANIVVLDSDIFLGTSSDKDGLFYIENVPIGRHTLKITYIGYKDLVIPKILVGSAKEIVLDLKLTESLVSIDEVVVSAKQEKRTSINNMTTVSAKSFTIEETKRYPASLNDPGRMVLSFAGVSVGEDTRNEIIIRGNSPNSVLWRVEGMEIPPPNHFYEEGVSTGAISMLSANLLTHSDFLTGAFPSEYGNALSGVFDVSLRNGNNQKNESAFQFGALGTDIALEGPFNEDYKGSYLINYRYSTLSMLNKIGVTVPGDYVPEYQDLSFKLHIPSKNLGIFSIWGIGGISSANIEAEKDSSQWELFSDRENDISEMKMMAIGVSNIFSTSKSSFLKSTISFSGTESIDEQSFFTNNYELVKDDYYKLTNYSTRLSILFNQKLNSQFSYRLGGNLSQLKYNYKINEYLQNRLDIIGNGSTFNGQLFFQSKYKLSKALTLNVGLHMMKFWLNNEIILEPRTGIYWEFTPTQSISLGYGKHSRHEFLSTYLNPVFDHNNKPTYPNKELKLTKAHHYVLSYNNFISNELHLKIETYFQHLYDIPLNLQESHLEAPINNIYKSDSLFNGGAGKNYGAEVTLEKYFSNKYFFLLNVSLYKSLIESADGKWYSTRFNGGFSTNFVAGSEFHLNSKDFLSFNVKTIYSGGTRGMPFENGELNRIDRFGRQYKNYFRIDLNIGYHLNMEGVRHIFFIDIQNITNEKNIYNMDYEVVNGIQKEYPEYQTGLLPTFNYRIEF